MIPLLICSSVLAALILSDTRYMVVDDTISPGGHGKGRKSNDASEISDIRDVSLNLR